jgi:hypothetical protein
MLTVSMTSEVSELDRATIDKAARNLVLNAYRSVRPSHQDLQANFDAALETYRRAYPHISKEIARHAVAYILATDGM